MNSNVIGVLDLAAYARNYGYAVDAYYLEEINMTNQYDLIGLSIFEGENDAIFADITYLKNVYKGTKIIVGGRWTKIMDSRAIDWMQKNEIEVVIGEGEKYFNRGEDINYDTYPGWYKKDLLTMHVKGRNIMSSRGCPFQCHFCHNPEKDINYFNSNYTADNIQMLFEQGLEQIFFVDDIFTLNISHMMNIRDTLLRRQINLDKKNLFFTHVNLINENNSEIMKLFNPLEVQVGLESGDDIMLKRMGKNFNAEKAFNKVSTLSKYVPVNGLFLIGYPGETITSLQNTVEFVKRLKPYLSNKWVSLFQPIKNTRGYYEALKEGDIKGELRNNSIIHYLPEGLKEEDLIKYRNLIMQI